MKDHIIISVGRQFGSGGKSVANALGEKLGIKVYNNEILSQAAEVSGISKDLFLKKDEKKSILTIANIFGANRYGGAESSGVSDIDIFKIQSDVIRSIAERESAIFVGRASDYVLRDMDCPMMMAARAMKGRLAVFSICRMAPMEMTQRSVRIQGRYLPFLGLEADTMPPATREQQKSMDFAMRRTVPICAAVKPR